jgi:transposase, IS30 family
MNYTHLSQTERYQIYVLTKAGHTQKKIAELLQRSTSTISRELFRNRGQRGYRARQAQRKALARRAMNAYTIAPAIWHIAKAKLLQEWSPEQVSAHVSISHETIYQRVYADKHNGGVLWRQLRCQKQRKKRYGKTERRGIIPHRRGIETRPGLVEQRQRIGDIEADTIIGKSHKSAVVSLVDRKSGYTWIKKVTRKTAQQVGHAIIQLLTPYRHRVHTITADNGREFAGHLDIAKRLNTDFYFARPYASWQRGTNENTNGLIRQYFPKHRDFTTITQQEINHAMKRLNHRPRKRLGYRTPHQVFFNM